MKKDINNLFVYPKEWEDTQTRNIAASIKEWANKEIISKRIENQKNYRAFAENARKILAFDIGCQGLMLPEASGGAGFNRLEDTSAFVSILKEIGRADTGLGFIYALEYTVLALIFLYENDNPELCEFIISSLGSKNFNTVSLILPAAGSIDTIDHLFEGRSIRVTLSPHSNGKEYILNGSKLRPIGCGKDAKFFCVICSGENGEPYVAFVPSKLSGLKHSDVFKKTGLELCDNSDIDFDNVHIPETYIIKREGAAHEIYAWLNLFLSSISIGACMGSLEIVSEWSEKRVIKSSEFLKDNSLCASVLSDIFEEIQISLILVNHLAYHLRNPKEWGGAGSKNIFCLSQMLGGRIQKSCLNAINRVMELMASQGYAKESYVEKMWRDVKTIKSLLSGIGGELPAKLDIARFVFNSNYLNKEVNYEII